MRFRVVVWLLLLLIVGLLAWQLYGTPHARKMNAIPAFDRTPMTVLVNRAPEWRNADAGASSGIS